MTQSLCHHSAIFRLLPPKPKQCVDQQQQLIQSVQIYFPATRWPIGSRRYVTLDADVLFLKPHTGFADFFDEQGRAVTNLNEKRYLHDKWWYSAAMVLQTDPTDLIADREDVIGVTPCVMNRGIVQNLTKYLSTLYEDGDLHWASTLLFKSTEWVWTE